MDEYLTIAEVAARISEIMALMPQWRELILRAEIERRESQRKRL